jgi:SAM-dependent methyltransferase
MPRRNQTVLDQLYEYDSFLDSLRTIADMGCGTGEDITWWANLTTRDDPPVPHNYQCYAVDRDAAKLKRIPDQPNIFKINRDFTQQCLPVKIDLMWAYDSLQYSTDPLETLKVWNQMMNQDGMLVLAVPQHSGVQDGRYFSKAYSGVFYHYTPTNLIYMLAVNGFDCRDAYLLKQFNDPWIFMAVYKSSHTPMDPAVTSWAELIDKKLLHPTVEKSIISNGHLRQEEICMPWLDKENYFIDYVSTWTEVPAGAGEPKVVGVFNQTVMTEDHVITQAPATAKETRILKPIGVLRPPKKVDK